MSGRGQPGGEAGRRDVQKQIRTQGCSGDAGSLDKTTGDDSQVIVTCQMLVLNIIMILLMSQVHGDLKRSIQVCMAEPFWK